MTESARMLGLMERQIERYVEEFRFKMPGYEGCQFHNNSYLDDHRNAERLHLNVKFQWEMPDTLGLADRPLELTIYKHHTLRGYWEQWIALTGALTPLVTRTLDQLAWAALYDGVTHEMGEFFWHHKRQPADPHRRGDSADTWWQTATQRNWVHTDPEGYVIR